MSRKWVWVIWWAALTVCPLVMSLIGVFCEGEYNPFNGGRSAPLVVHLLPLFMLAHLGLSMACAAALWRLHSEFVRRYVACLAILAMFIITVYVWLQAEDMVGVIMYL